MFHISTCVEILSKIVLLLIMVTDIKQLNKNKFKFYLYNYARVRFNVDSKRRHFGARRSVNYTSWNFSDSVVIMT